MTRNLFLPATFLISMVVSAPAHPVAQDAPDFSGHWILVSVPPSAGNFARALSVSMRIVRTNVRGEPMKPFFKDMVVTREFAKGNTTETYLLGAVGGTVAGIGARPSTHQRVVWEKQTLIIETGSHIGPVPESGEWTERREVWSLDSNQDLRLEIAGRSSGGPPLAATLVYRRQ